MAGAHYHGFDIFTSLGSESNVYQILTFACLTQTGMVGRYWKGEVVYKWIEIKFAVNTKNEKKDFR